MICYLYICKLIGLRVHIGVHPVRVAGEGEDRVATNIGNNYFRATLSCRFVDIADNYGSVNLPAGLLFLVQSTGAADCILLDNRYL